MSADYEVKAELVVNSRAAAAGLSTLSSKLGTMGQALRGQSSMFTGMVGQAVAFGAAYVGVNAMVGGFARLTMGAFEFAKEIGSAQLGLQTIMAQVEHMDGGLGEGASQAERMAAGFEEAGRASQATYLHLQDMAITSSATSGELLGMFQSVYATARNAGTSMEGIYEMTGNAATAAAALGIDFQQANRDMGAMLRGGAGMEVRLFQSLRSMGAITKDARDFNALNPAERVAYLANALQGFQVANEAYGRSLPGALSTTRDLFEVFRGAFFGPAFTMMAENLNDLNAYLIANKDAIKNYLTNMGGEFQEFLERGLMQADSVFRTIHMRWQYILDQMHKGVQTFMRLAPVIASWGATFVKMKLAASALGVALSAGSWLASAGAGLVELAGVLGLGGAAAGAAGAAGGAAAGGAAAAAGGAAAGGMGATMATLSASLSALAWPITLVVAGLVALWQGVQDFSAILMPMASEVGTIFSGIGADLMAIFGDLWDFVGPILSSVGAVLGGVILTAFRVLGGVLRVITGAFRILASVIGWVGRNVIKPVFETIAETLLVPIELFGQLGDVLGSLVTKIVGWLGLGNEDPEPPVVDQRSLANGTAEAYRSTFLAQHVETVPTPEAAPAARTTTINDMRGSRITVNQEFREADPDRVALRMLEDIARFAEQRVESGFAPAFTR